MKTQWLSEKGRLACRWYDLGSRRHYDLRWMMENLDVRGNYLEPVPDFASHSPFGGASWFELHFAVRDEGDGPARFQL